MDVAKFRDWLSAIAALTPRQRQQAWQALALSEASQGDALEVVLSELAPASIAYGGV